MVAEVRPFKVVEDKRTLIEIGPRIDVMTRQATDALRHHPDVFERSGFLVHVTRATDREATHSAPTAIDTPVIRPIGKATLRSMMCQCINFARYDGRSHSHKETTPPDSVVAAVHEAGEWHGLRRLIGVSGTPMLRPDGTILQERGFDPATNHLYLPAERYPRVPDDPTQEDAREALAQLLQPFELFPFATQAARMVPIAAILTQLARAAIAGAVPGFAFEASTRGSGKTLLATAVSMITEGVDCPRASWPDQDDAEAEKIIGAYAQRGARLIAFDNITGPVGGGPIDRVLTARDAIECRTLGRSEILTLPWRAIVVLTGNNLDVRGDTTRRLLFVRLEPDTERPEDRDGLPDLFLQLVRSRPRLVTAALTLLRAYFVAGKPTMFARPWGSFEAWARLIPPAILFAGGVDPMEARRGNETAEDPDTGALLAILDSLPRLDPSGRGLMARDLVRLLYPDGKAPKAGTEPDGYDDLRAALEHLSPPRSGAPDPNRIGARLRHARGRWINGFRLMAATAKGGVLRWRVERRAEPAQSGEVPRV